jgi:hypothetical protein
MENREGDWRVESKVRPTLVVGIGEWGTQVANAFARRVERRARGQLPVVRSVALVCEEEETESFRKQGGLDLTPSDKNLVSAELEQIRRLDVVRAARHAGWGVESKAGSEVVLVASLGGDGIGDAASELARWLHASSERDLAHRLALSGVFLLPRDAESVESAESDGECAPNEEDGGRSFAATDLPLFDEGCYLLDQVNADGLLVDDGETQADLVACWLVLRVMTGLRTILDQAPLNFSSVDDEGARTRLLHAHFDTFGLAAWEFPSEPLTAHLTQRWQCDALEQILGSPGVDQGDDRGAVSLFLERHTQAEMVGSLSPEALRFQVPGDAWATPALNLIRTLREEIDEAVKAEEARLRDLIVQENKRLDEVCVEAQRDLAAEVNTLLDGPGMTLGAAEAFLVALEDAVRRRVTRLEHESAQCCARTEGLEPNADKAGQALDKLTAGFPPLHLRTLLGLALRPWRLLPLWLRYREIGQQVGAYLAYRQSQWLLQAEAYEWQWRAAFCARLAQAVEEEREEVGRLRTQLEQLRIRLASDLDEAATLPPGLADYFYRQATGGPRANPATLLAIYGPLSRWTREGCDVETLALTLAEHAREQFVFLAKVRLDGLLAHTYSGPELRRRLATLVDAASPWWVCDESAMDAEERTRLRRLVLVGLPDAESSLLVDLLPNRPHAGTSSCFSTNDRRQVVAVQAIQGLRIGDRMPRLRSSCPLGSGEDDSGTWEIREWHR